MSGEIGAAGRVVPADQRFEAGDFLSRGADDRLICDPQLVAFDRLPQVILEQLAFGRLAVHRRLIKAVLAAAGGLRGVERKVGVAHERVGAGAAGIADRDPDRGADHDLVTFDEIGA